MISIKNEINKISLKYISLACFVVFTLSILFSYPSSQYIYGKTPDRVTIHDLLPFDPGASEKSAALNATVSHPTSTSKQSVLANNMTSLKNGSTVSTIDSGAMTDHTITVSGSGSLKVKPNLATVHLSITTSRNNVEAAYVANLVAFQNLTSSITNVGTKDNKTSNFGLQNVSSIISIKQENNTKYAITRSILIKATNMTAITVLLDKALKAGANVDRIQFGLSENMMDDQRISVMEKALGDAWKKARDAAILLDVRVIGIKSLSIDGFSFSNEAYFPASNTSNFASSLVPSSVDLIMNVSQSFLFRERG
jgi:uncharacterized protein